MLSGCLICYNTLMIIVEMLGWWYTRGWLWIAQQIYIVELGRVFDFFSIKDLLKTLFAPFRQDVIDTKRAPIGIKLQVFGANLISRILGAMIRATLILVGIISAMLLSVLGFLFLIAWPFFPIVPLVSVALLIGVI